MVFLIVKWCRDWVWGHGAIGPQAKPKPARCPPPPQKKTQHPFILGWPKIHFNTTLKLVVNMQITALKRLIGCRCSKFHWDDLKPVEDIWYTICIWIFKNHEKRGITIELLELATQNICHKHRLFIWIMCSKFNWDDLKNMQEVWDTNFLYMDM